MSLTQFEHGPEALVTLYNHREHDPELLPEHPRRSGNDEAPTCVSRASRRNLRNTFNQAAQPINVIKLSPSSATDFLP